MYSIESRIRYSEVNSERELTLSSLLDYLQDCCTFQSEDMGVGVEYLTREHVAWVLSSWQVEILRFPQMGDRVKVSTWPYDFKGFYGYRNFLIEDETGEMLARANSIWVFMDTERMRPARITKELQDAYADEIKPALEAEWGERKLAIPTEGVKQEPVQVAKFHIDTNHHMNNGKYVLVAEEYLPEDFAIGGLRVEYKKAAVLGDILYPMVYEETDKVTVVLADEADRPYAIVEFQRK